MNGSPFFPQHMKHFKQKYRFSFDFQISEGLVFTIFFFSSMRFPLISTFYDESHGLMSQAHCMRTAVSYLMWKNPGCLDFLESNLMHSLGGQVFHFPL